MFNRCDTVSCVPFWLKYVSLYYIFLNRKGPGRPLSLPHRQVGAMSIDPSEDEARAFRNIQSIFDWVGLQVELQEPYLIALGLAANMHFRILAAIPQTDLDIVLNQLMDRIDASPAQRAQVGLVGRAAKVAAGAVPRTT